MVKSVHTPSYPESWQELLLAGSALGHVLQHLDRDNLQEKLSLQESEIALILDGKDSLVKHLRELVHAFEALKIDQALLAKENRWLRKQLEGMPSKEVV